MPLHLDLHVYSRDFAQRRATPGSCRKAVPHHAHHLPSCESCMRNIGTPFRLCSWHCCVVTPVSGAACRWRLQQLPLGALRACMMSLANSPPSSVSCGEIGGSLWETPDEPCGKPSGVHRSVSFFSVFFPRLTGRRAGKPACV